MTAYESLLMVNPDVSEADRKTILKRAEDLIKKNGGSWNGVDEWGLRELAYEINHHQKAHYYLLDFGGNGETVEETSRTLRITDGVMRVIPTVKHEYAELPMAERGERSGKGSRGRRGR